ncbi:hypothetical protein K501DRAFT_176093 [Backusella circina FSU 941]|nr:hypothetical protein K501DRAFT_176093 [Backusella circina FSU 941]
MFSGEILQSQLSTGEFFELNPFNFMLGPSVEIMIQTGARFTPCMRDTNDMPPGENFVCLSTLVKSDLALLDIITEPELDNVSCSLQSLCGMTGFHQQERPDQTFRFITPLVVHTGIFHLAVNCWYLYMLGTRLERVIGSLSYSVLFLGTGIFGHAFGSIFAHTTTPFLGCSSALFGMIGYLFIDLMYHWKTLEHASLYLVKLLVLTAFSFILGILPW